jgi:uncharacterized protein YjcR
MRARNPATPKLLRLAKPKRAAPAPPEALRRRFRIAQVAEAFGCAPRTVRSWIEKGLLGREKVGNAVFIREDQIEAMLLGPAREKNGNKIKHTRRASKNTTQ